MKPPIKPADVQVKACNILRCCSFLIASPHFPRSRLVPQSAAAVDTWTWTSLRSRSTAHRSVEPPRAERCAHPRWIEWNGKTRHPWAPKIPRSSAATCHRSKHQSWDPPGLRRGGWPDMDWRKHKIYEMLKRSQKIFKIFSVSSRKNSHPKKRENPNGLVTKTYKSHQKNHPSMQLGGHNQQKLRSFVEGFGSCWAQGHRDDRRVSGEAVNRTGLPVIPDVPQRGRRNSNPPKKVIVIPPSSQNGIKWPDMTRWRSIYVNMRCTTWDAILTDNILWFMIQYDIHQQLSIAQSPQGHG